ncbi:MAG: hypothetical protein IKO19_01950 [Candidatus Riflebacteria bacterium]|nr:hypothetical protein [Candidatus Riflebacteria bacterium]
MKTLELYIHSAEEQTENCELARIPEILKEHEESCFRSSFFSEDAKKNCFGPLTLTFAVRTAKDLLLEGCEYQGLEVKLETAGKLLPAIPAHSELQKLLEAPDTIVHVNGHIYKPNTEVFGFQQVYDDSVKCIDGLKKLGFNNESMAIYATPDDITVEVSPSAIGLEGNSELSSRYYRLLCHLADIKEVGGKPQKTDVKTILLNSVLPEGKILLPGSPHPTLRRVKVGVGASHFAYGIAAFSDTCGKKRSKDECIQEVLNWLKFIDKELPAVKGIRELLDTLPNIALPGKSNKSQMVQPAASAASAASSSTQSSGSAKSFIGVFQSLKSELEDSKNDFKDIPQGVTAFSTGLDKILGHGWSIGGLHLIIGGREQGKAAFVLQQAILSENKIPVLYVSYEQTLKNFVMNTACLIGGINKSEMMAGLVGPNANQVKGALSAAVDKLQAKLSQNLYFSGIEAGRVKFEADDILQLADMLPEAASKMIVIESISEDDLGENAPAQLQKLKAAAAANNYSILMSIHTKNSQVKRPNIIEESDIDCLGKYQRFSDTIINLETEKTNLRKFVALVKGQVDAALVANLEQKALQLCGGKKLKTDSYCFSRVIHNRNGKRDMILFLYQPDMGRFFELATVPLSRP